MSVTGIIPRILMVSGSHTMIFKLNLDKLRDCLKQFYLPSKVNWIPAAFHCGLKYPGF